MSTTAPGNGEEIGYPKRQPSLARGAPSLVNADGSVVLFTSDSLDSGGVHLGRPVALWSESTGTLSLSELDGSEELLGVTDSGVVALFNDADEVDPGVPETVVSSIPLRWSPVSGRQDLAIPTGYEYGRATAYSSDASIVAGFALNGSYLGPTAYSEGALPPSANDRGRHRLGRARSATPHGGACGSD